jgi:ABC-2 type transport system permease protein
MRKILAMTRKEFFLWAQKPGSWIIVFIVPILFIWIIQAVFGGTGTPVVTVFAVNEDAGSEGVRVMAALRDATNLQIEELKTAEEADRRVGTGERMAAIVVPKGFTEAVGSKDGGSIDIIIDPARSEQANIVVGLANAALAPILVDAEVSRGVEESIDRIMLNLEPSETVEGSNQTAAPQETVEPTVAPEVTSEFNATLTPEVTSEVTPEVTQEITPEVTPTAEAGTGDGGSSDPGQLRKFFSAAMKGVVSSQVQEAMDDPQVILNVQPAETAAGTPGASTPGASTPGAVTPGAVTPETKIPARRPSLLDYLVPGYSLMFVFFLIPNLAVTVIEERETGTLRRLLVSPVARSAILLGKMLPFFLIAVVQFIFVLLVSKLIFGISLGGSPLALIILILASSAAMAGLGILIGALARSEAQADGLAVVLVLAMAVISGAMFPGIQIPGLQYITPHYWSMQGFLNVVSRGMGIEGVLLPTGILITMAALFFTLGAIRFRFE